MILSGKNNKNSFPIKTFSIFFRTLNEKIRSIQYELLTARTEVEQKNEKVLPNDFHRSTLSRFLFS